MLMERGARGNALDSHNINSWIDKCNLKRLRLTLADWCNICNGHKDKDQHQRCKVCQQSIRPEKKHTPCLRTDLVTSRIVDIFVPKEELIKPPALFELSEEVKE